MTEPTPREKDINKLIQSIGLYGGTAHTTSPYEKAKAELFAVCTENLIASIDNNSQSSHALAKKIFWLNVILTSATVIGTLTALLNLLLKYGN